MYVKVKQQYMHVVTRFRVISYNYQINLTTCDDICIHKANISILNFTMVQCSSSIKDAAVAVCDLVSIIKSNLNVPILN